VAFSSFFVTFLHLATRSLGGPCNNYLAMCTFLGFIYTLERSGTPGCDF
jgi:hypothetical protein